MFLPSLYVALPNEHIRHFFLGSFTPWVRGEEEGGQKETTPPRPPRTGESPLFFRLKRPSLATSDRSMTRKRPSLFPCVSSSTVLRYSRSSCGFCEKIWRLFFFFCAGFFFYHKRSSHFRFVCGFITFWSPEKEIGKKIIASLLSRYKVN